MNVKTASWRSTITVAAYRGVELKTHADLWSFTTKLSSELGDSEILTLFATANHPHQNLYENAMTLEAVKLLDVSYRGIYHSGWEATL